jgi:hypothetical protein
MLKFGRLINSNEIALIFINKINFLTMANTNKTPQVLIYGTLSDIDNETPNILTFDNLEVAHLWLDMVHSEYTFPLIKILDKNGNLYLELEN